MLLRDSKATAAFVILILTVLVMLPSANTLLPKYVNSSTFSRSVPLSLNVPSPAFTFTNLVFDVLTRSPTVPAVLANLYVSSC